MATRLQPHLNEMIDRKRSALEGALSRHKELLIGIEGAMKRRSDSLERRLSELEGSTSVIERLYGELSFLSDVAGIRPPSRDSL
jgi:hypothetical protein